MELVDYKSKKSNFNSTEFINFLNQFKEKIDPLLCPDEIVSKYNFSKVDILKSGSAVIILDTLPFGSPGRLMSQNSEFKDVLHEDAEVFPVPIYTGGLLAVAEPINSIGINSKCKYKQAAFAYIKKLLSADFHEQHYNYIFSATVNKEALSREKENYSNSLGGAMIANLDNINENIGDCGFSDNRIYKIIREELKDFLNGRNSAEQAARNMDDKAAL